MVICGPITTNQIFSSLYIKVGLRSSFIILSTIGKLAETFILKWILQETERLELIPNQQLGFIRQCGPIHQLTRMVDHIQSKLNAGCRPALVTLDLSSAFDKVWHSGLCLKLARAGLNNSLLRVISSYLENRSFEVRMGSESSSIRPIRSGVPQGSKNAPLLFNIFVADPPTCEAVFTAQYADDTATLQSQNLLEKKNPPLAHKDPA